MATALDLEQAAGQAFDNLSVRWLAGQLKTVIQDFCTQTLAIFPQQRPNGNPASNWITVFWALAEDMPDTDIPIDQLSDAAEILYRLCWMAFTLVAQGLVSGAAGSALLIRYNNIIGFP